MKALLPLLMAGIIALALSGCAQPPYYNNQNDNPPLKTPVVDDRNL